MSRSNPLIRKITEINASGRVALCGYFLTGYDTPKHFYSLVRSCDCVDIFEFGIPSETPHLDGITIAQAHNHVYSKIGMDAETSLSLIGGLAEIHQPRFIMTYTKEARELDGFLKLCLKNNIHGILAPDVPIEEAQRVALIASSLHLAYVGFVDTSMTAAQIQSIVQLCDIVYLKVSHGSTGVQGVFCEATLHMIKEHIRAIRNYKQNILIAAGIGIQTPEHIQKLAFLDINMVIVGTALVEKVPEGTCALKSYVNLLSGATQRYPSVYEESFLLTSIN